jgi:hypothetical protein
MLKRFSDKWGAKFDPSALAPEFVPFFESQERIEVNMGYGNDGPKRQGRVSVTTGWKPCFILMSRVSDSGSSETLGRSDHYVKTIAK